MKRRDTRVLERVLVQVAELWQLLARTVEQTTRGIVPARLASFLAVGVIGFGVHMALLYGALGLGVSFAPAQGTAALLASTFNFLLNNVLTFRDRRYRGQQLLRGAAVYLVMSLVGLVANVGVATWIYVQLDAIAFIAALAGIAIDVLWKFIVSDRYVWARGQR